jgi:hypothetical protein
MNSIRPESRSECGQLAVLGGDDATRTGESGRTRDDKLPDPQAGLGLGVVERRVG